MKDTMLNNTCVRVLGSRSSLPWRSCLIGRLSGSANSLVSARAGAIISKQGIRVLLPLFFPLAYPQRNACVRVRIVSITPYRVPLRLPHDYNKTSLNIPQDAPCEIKRTVRHTMRIAPLLASAPQDLNGGLRSTSHRERFIGYVVAISKLFFNDRITYELVHILRVGSTRYWWCPRGACKRFHMDRSEHLKHSYGHPLRLRDDILNDALRDTLGRAPPLDF